MTRFFVIALAVAGAVTAFAQEKEKADAIGVTGKWAMTLEMEVGTAATTLVFKQDAEGKLVGTYTGRYGTYPLAGKIEGKAIEFVVTINAEGTETRMSFWGELAMVNSAEVLRGSATLGGMGDATWLAKRDTKK